mmetsp:Transcript_20804/g.23150  ORF Transcript_20804/g.23150 Transcript_20804/m.23150 type:complete len:105 (+) Transcript_20804:55-369(+)
MFLILTAVFFLVLAVYIAFEFIIPSRRVKMNKKAVLITGCDSGFGNMLARRLDELGIPVFAACLTNEGAEVLQSCTSERVATLICDVTNHVRFFNHFIYFRTTS